MRLGAILKIFYGCFSSSRFLSWATSALYPTILAKIQEKILIDFNDAEKALEYLKGTDKEAARAKSYAAALDDAKKTVLAFVYNDLTEGSAADRQKKAEGSDDYHSHLEKLRKANEEWETLRNKRKSAELQIEMWRSINSNQRKGNI